VAVADSFDAMTSARPYRMALSQQYAIAELRRHAGGQFHPEVVDSFESALIKTGQRWGAPHVNDEEMARRLAEDPELTLRG
jgi:HD-GYP domain-containing protein (c-di-GMP phosphodiesterase class II)